MARGRSAGNGRFGVAKSKRRGKYPTNWKEISKAVRERDGFKCTKCGATREVLKRKTALDGKPRRFETHHINSVQTANHKKINLRTLCSDCHEKQPGHKHLGKRNG